MNLSEPAAGPKHDALLDLLRTTEAVWNASRLFFAKWGLSSSQFNILQLLRGKPEGLSQIDLSRELITHRSNVTGLIDRLEERNLVCRKAKDRRTWQVILTLEGERMVKDILPEYYALSEEVWDGISARRAKEITHDLVRLREGAEKLSGKLEAK